MTVHVCVSVCLSAQVREREAEESLQCLTDVTLAPLQVASSPNYWCSDWSVDSSSVNAWLTSIGLPMYVERFAEAGFTMVAHLSQLKDSHYKQLDLNDPLHKEFIVEGLKRLAK